MVRALDTNGRVLVTTRRRDLVGEALQVAISGLEGAEVRHRRADWPELPPHSLEEDCETILEMRSAVGADAAAIEPCDPPARVDAGYFRLRRRTLCRQVCLLIE